MLRYELENHVQLINYAPDTATLDMTLTPDIVEGFHKKFKENLEQWTGISWTITVEKQRKSSASETGSAPGLTLRDQKNKNKADLMTAAKKTPLVKKTLDTFEGSELTNVKPLKD